MKKSFDAVLDLQFHSAQGFYDVGIHLAEAVTKDKDISGFQRLGVAAMTMSFAAELLLKALLNISQKQIKGHHLKNLFYELPFDLRKKIEDKFISNAEKEKDNKRLGDFRIKITKVTKNDSSKGESKDNKLSLDQFLTIHNKGFENWRYLYEIEKTGFDYTINFNLLDCFMKAMIDTVNETELKKRLFLSKVNP